MSRFEPDLRAGDRVKVIEGAFEKFEGVVEAIDSHARTVKVTVTIFGNPTTVEFEHWQVVRI